MKALIVLLLSISSLSWGQSEYYDGCDEGRSLNISTKFLGDYRVDIINAKNNLCDTNKILISKFVGEYNKEKIIESLDMGQGASMTTSFLDGQEFQLNNYVWFEFFPSSRNWYHFGYYLGENEEIYYIEFPELTNCKYEKENSLKCRSQTTRDINISKNPKCTIDKIPYDTIIYNFDKQNYTAEMVKEGPIPEECK